jgi:hypothetical protein
VLTQTSAAIDNRRHVERLEQRHEALEIIRELFAPRDVDLGELRLRTAAGHGHSVERIGNQFGSKLVGVFLKVDEDAAWAAYSSLRPRTVGEEMALLLNRREFTRMHAHLHHQLRIGAYARSEAMDERFAGFERADRDQFAGPGSGSLAELASSGLVVRLGAEHARRVAAAWQQLGDSGIPLSEALKFDRIVTVSGKKDSKISLVVHDAIDHLWALRLLQERGVLAEYDELLAAIGDPQDRDIRSREGEVVASIAFGIRLFNALEPGFTPIISAHRIRKILERRVGTEAPERQRRALQLVQDLTLNHRSGRETTTFAGQTLAFTLSNYVTELNEQRRKHGKIKQRLAGGAVRELPPLDVDFLSFVVASHAELTKPKNQHLNTLGRAQLLIEQWLQEVATGRAEPPFELIVTLESIDAYQVETTPVPRNRVRWMLDRYGFAASPVYLS